MTTHAAPNHNAASTPVRYLNQALINDFDFPNFQNKQPFPWANPQGFLNPATYQELLDNMPPLERFTASFGKQRKSGQTFHDRYILDYNEGIDLPAPWSQLMEEMLSNTYRRFVCNLLNVSNVRMRFHWHYTPTGAEVGPHCDSKGKIGSQIFYLNSPDDWNPGWGGETVILDDKGCFPTYSAPRFEDFDQQWPAQTMDNRCIIFGRRGNSWHGVKRINCPEGKHRKVFIVVFEEYQPIKVFFKKLGRLLTGKPMTSEKERLTF